MATNDIFDYIAWAFHCLATISNSTSVSINGSFGSNNSPAPHVTSTKLYKYSDILFKYLNHLPR